MSLKAGEVVKKYHTDDFFMMVPMQSGDTTIYIQQYYPESWTVVIEGNDPKGVHKTRSVDVDKCEFNKIEVGKTISFE